jgi:hypothetical protein
VYVPVLLNVELTLLHPQIVGPNLGNAALSAGQT